MLKEVTEDDVVEFDADASSVAREFGSGVSPDVVRRELELILASRHFKASRRSKQFLQYVVNEEIRGNGDLLKERSLGIHIFGRKPDYAAGEDPIVRVQAGEVRHRLERYHADPACQSDIVIEIPLGSYAPIFRNRKDARSDGQIPVAMHGRQNNERHSSIAQPSDGAVSSGGEIDHRQQKAESVLLGANGERQNIEVGFGTDPKARIASRRTALRRVEIWRAVIPWLSTCALVCCLAALYLHTRPDPTLKAFWSPASGSSKPVLLWLPKPMVYRPSDKLFERYGKSHSNAFVTREARQDGYLPLDPAETIQWSDMIPVRDSGPGIGGVIAALNISRLLTEQGIRFEMRFGPEATYAEMRDSPVVIVGAINSDWATQLTSQASFAFDESIAAPSIYETKGAKRVWKLEVIDGHKTRDYGLVTRQVSGKAGPFLVQVAGISHFGTEAASEMLLDHDGLAKIWRSESTRSQKKNLQIVVSTDITDGRAGPPHVVAVGSW